MIYHLKSGFHYVHVFPDGEFFEEVFLSHEISARRNWWMSAVRMELLRMVDFEDERKFFIFWQSVPENFPLDAIRGRKAIRFTESLDVDKNRLQTQKDYFERFKRLAGRFDYVIAHTPTAVDTLREHAENVILLPIGYEPEAYGIPNWEVQKEHDIVFYGSISGKRKAVFQVLEKQFAGRFTVVSGYGRKRKKILDLARISLYVGHCEDPSFGTSRLWQTIASSAVLATEERDAWPASPGRHYLPLPKADPENMEDFTQALEECLKRDDLPAIAKAAYDDLSWWSVKECMEKYLIRQTAEVR